MAMYRLIPHGCVDCDFNTLASYHFKTLVGYHVQSICYKDKNISTYNLSISFHSSSIHPKMERILFLISFCLLKQYILFLLLFLNFLNLISSFLLFLFLFSFNQTVNKNKPNADSNFLLKISNITSLSPN